ncbi:hypothetical protein T09_431 [Trichinella sp. T9]|nr:hypothetical protein T09_431 [Trichinella sp. T9]
MVRTSGGGCAGSNADQASSTTDPHQLKIHLLVGGPSMPLDGCSPISRGKSRQVSSVRSAWGPVVGSRLLRRSLSPGRRRTCPTALCPPASADRPSPGLRNLFPAIRSISRGQGVRDATRSSQMLRMQRAVNSNFMLAAISSCTGPSWKRM